MAKASLNKKIGSVLDFNLHDNLNDFEFYKDGTIVTPTTSTEDIENSGDKVLITKEYAEDNYSSTLTQDQQDALDNANNPNAANPVATMDDLGASTFIELTDTPIQFEKQWSIPTTNEDKTELVWLDSFSDVQTDRLKALVYEDLIRSGTRTPTSFEKGLATTIDFSYNISENDDDITKVVWDGIETIVAPFPLTGTAQDVGAVNTSNRVLEVEIENGTVDDLIITSTAYRPQYRGVSTLTDFDGTYTQLNNELTKVIQSSDNQSSSFAMSAEYSYFISINSNAIIKDGNNFTQTIGTWGNGVSEFYKKSFTMTLADGTTEVMTMYRLREVKTTTLTYSLT